MVNQGSEPVRLDGQATLLGRSPEGSHLFLKGEAALLVLYRLKQRKTAENLKKAKRAGLYPHCLAAARRQKQSLEQRVLNVAWWECPCRGCPSWCSDDQSTRTSHKKSAWKRERYTAPYRVPMVNPIGPLEPENEGFPLIFTGDNGSEFVPDVTREMNRFVGAAQVFGLAYHPRSPSHFGSGLGGTAHVFKSHRAKERERECFA